MHGLLKLAWPLLPLQVSGNACAANHEVASLAHKVDFGLVCLLLLLAWVVQLLPAYTNAIKLERRPAGKTLLVVREVEADHAAGPYHTQTTTRTCVGLPVTPLL